MHGTQKYYRVFTKIGYSVNMLLLRNFLYNHSHILYEVLHWGLLKFSNEVITHLINLKFQWNYSTKCYYIKQLLDKVESTMQKYWACGKRYWTRRQPRSISFFRGPIFCIVDETESK